MKLSIGLRVDEESPPHMELSIFYAIIPDEMSHTEATRYQCGTLVIRTDDFDEILKRIKPDVLVRPETTHVWDAVTNTLKTIKTGTDYRGEE